MTVISKVISTGVISTIIIIVLTLVIGLILEKTNAIPKSVTAGMVGSSCGKMLNRANAVTLLSRSFLDNFLRGINLRKTNTVALKLNYLKESNAEKYQYLTSQDYSNYVDTYAIGHPTVLGALQTFTKSTIGGGYQKDTAKKQQSLQSIEECRQQELERKQAIREQVDVQIKEEYPVINEKECNTLRKELYKKMKQEVSQEQLSAEEDTANIAYKLGQQTNQLGSSIATASKKVVSNMKHTEQKPVVTTEQDSAGLAWQQDSEISLKDKVVNLSTETEEKDSILEKDTEKVIETNVKFSRAKPTNPDYNEYEDEFGPPITLDKTFKNRPDDDQPSSEKSTTEKSKNPTTGKDLCKSQNQVNKDSLDFTINSEGVWELPEIDKKSKGNEEEEEI